MPERMIHADGIDLCAEDFGDPAQPALLLVMGAQASMLWWPKDFCEQLAERGFHVIRYDHRDVGRSTTYGLGRATYDLNDLTQDIFRVLDGFGIRCANLVGFSMGGYLAQAAAIAQPDRVASLTIWGAGPLDDVPGLPEMDADLLDFLISAMPQDWTDERAVVDFHVEGARRMRGDRFPFNEATQTELARAEFHRARDRASALNHASYDTQHPGGAAMLRMPTLIIHGDSDPVTPVEHGQALAALIPNARLMRLEGVGHELPSSIWSAVIDAVAANTHRDNIGLSTSS
jgi:pimeloyl-ACP methyl ester carboxylesterase